MNFSLGWEPDAKVELHQLWATLPNPAAVRSASATAERLLASDPMGIGRFLSEELWKTVIPPLVFYFTIDLARQHVQITDVLANH